MKNYMLATTLGLLTLTGNALAVTAAEMQQNKDAVLAFYDAALNHKDFRTAEKYMGAYYKQHNPNAADGKEGFQQFIEYLRTNFPDSHSDIKRVMAEEDYVILHVHSVRMPGTRGNAIVDIFKLDHGKIIEHWDVVQEIPEKSANENGMF